MDNYVEQIVVTKADSESHVKIIGSYLVAAVGVMLLLLYSPTVGILLSAAGFFLIYITKDQKNLEYEYEITNGDFSIDKIINKASRKHVFEFAEGDIQRILMFENPKFQNEIEVNKDMIIKDLTSCNEDNKCDWYVFMINKDRKTVAVVLELNDKSKNHVNSYFKKKVEL